MSSPAPSCWPYFEGLAQVLRGQNEELKLLLNQYLGSKINQELYVPPTATISRLSAGPDK